MTGYECKGYSTVGVLAQWSTGVLELEEQKL